MIESKDGSRRPTALEAIKKAEPVTLANLDRDCFIIPIASIDRFLPAGVPVRNQKNHLYQPKKKKLKKFPSNFRFHK